jgi:CubicO group peptidase (beta-lactamase class C family)
MRGVVARREVCCSLGLSLLIGLGGRARASAQHTAAMSVSDENRLARLKRQLEELQNKLRIPGLSAAVVRNQTSLWASRFGQADTANRVAATPETTYRIASLTKPFASTLLMQLVEEGKLDLDDPISKYSPEFQQRFNSGPVTVRQVFSEEGSHSDGLGFGLLQDVKGKGTRLILHLPQWM